MTSRSPVSPRRHRTAAAGAQIKGPAYPSSITPKNLTHLLTKHDEVARLRFLYIDECLEGSLRLMRSECGDVLNVGSDEMVSINAPVAMIAGVADKAVRLKHIPGPLGVRGRNSDNHLIAEKLGWRPREPLIRGIEKTYPWIAAQVAASRQRRGLLA